MAGRDFKTNPLIEAKDVPTGAGAHKGPGSVFGPADDTIRALQQRDWPATMRLESIWRWRV
jgi:hypothetical protein